MFQVGDDGGSVVVAVEWTDSSRTMETALVSPLTW